MDSADRAAHNEEVFRTINERIDEGAKQHGVKESLPFHCECRDETCVEKIERPPAENDRTTAARIPSSARQENEKPHAVAPDTIAPHRTAPALLDAVNRQNTRLSP